MNTKKAKALRREMGFDPKAPRSYESKVVAYRMIPTTAEDGTITKVRQDVIQIINTPDSPRARYQAAKRGM